MGDPKKHRKKYETPRKMWDSERIEVEGALVKEYGLKNMTELWKMESILRRYSANAKKLIAARTSQSEIERQQMLNKLIRQGLLPQSAKPEDVLGVKLNDILNRRLQTLIFRKGLARSQKQARQFVTHEHIFVGDKKITSPSYLVNVGEEGQIHFDSLSSLSSESHPERVILEKKGKKSAAAEQKQKKAAYRKPRKRSFKEGGKR